MSKIDNNKIKISGLEYLYDNGNLSNSDTPRNIPLKELFTFRDHPFLVEKKVWWYGGCGHTWKEKIITAAVVYWQRLVNV